MKKSIGYIIISICFAFSLFTGSYETASAASEEISRTLTDREVNEYFFDHDGNPYIIENGEILYVALPLDHLRVTNKSTLMMLDKYLEDISKTSSQIHDTILRAYPSRNNYYDISSGGYNVANSPVYTKHMDFDMNTTCATSVLKVNKYHSAFRFKVDNVVKKSWFVIPKISFTVYYFDPIERAWFEETYNNKSCTGDAGFGVAFSPSYTEYLYFEVTPASAIRSINANIWTTRNW